MDDRGGGEAVGFRRETPESARAQRNPSVGDSDKFLAIGRPSGLDVQVIQAEIEPAGMVRVVLCDLNRFPGLPILDRQDKNVEPAVRGGGNISDARSIGRPPRVKV